MSYQNEFPGKKFFNTKAKHKDQKGFFCEIRTLLASSPLCILLKSNTNKTDVKDYAHLGAPTIPKGMLKKQPHRVLPLNSSSVSVTLKLIVEA